MCSTQLAGGQKGEILQVMSNIFEEIFSKLKDLTLY